MPDERASNRGKPAIRHMNADDVRAVWQILQSAPEAAEWSEGSIRSSLHAQQTIALVSVYSEEITGSIFGVNVAGEAEILNLAVAPAHRRQGLARELVRHLLVELGRIDVRRVFLEVRESNAVAIQLYQELGFQKIGRRKRYYSAPEEDALVLERPGAE